MGCGHANNEQESCQFAAITQEDEGTKAWRYGFGDRGVRSRIGKSLEIITKVHIS